MPNNYKDNHIENMIEELQEKEVLIRELKKERLILALLVILVGTSKIMWG